jgi:hypothetical protein
MEHELTETFGRRNAKHCGMTDAGKRIWHMQKL